MRLENSARNLLFAWSGQVLYLICNFVTRGVFAAQLSQDYMALESLFTSVLSILSLAELGVGTAIVVSLYKPLAEDDVEKVRSLMRLFKRAYVTIGITIAIIGIALTPFIEVFIKNAPDIPYLHFYFLCFVLNSSLSYFFSYKGSLIIADQKKYKVSLIQYGFQIVMSLVQVAILMLTRNYFLFLFCMIGSTLLQNIVIAATANRMYPYLRSRTAIAAIDKETLGGIKKNAAALVVHRLAGIANTPVSTLIVSSFVGVGAVATYGIYNLVTGALGRIIDQAFDAIMASAGHMGATETKEHQHQIFQTSFFINAFLGALIGIPLLCILNQFVEVFWLGPDYVFPLSITSLLVFLFFAKNLRSAGLTFTGAFGLYWFTWWKALVEVVVLLVLSLVLGYFYAVVGVVVAAILNSIFISTTIEGYMLYKHGFERSSKAYFVKFILYLAATVLLAAVAFALCWLIPGQGLLSLFVRGAVALVVTVGGFALFFGRTREFRECLTMARRLLVAARNRFRRKAD